jgi:hypothetical protein
MLGAMKLGVAVVNQRIDIAVCNGINAASASAIATIRTTEWTEFFTAKRGHAVAAITSDHFDSGFVNELHDVPFCIP